jgi:outer membrane protein
MKIRNGVLALAALAAFSITPAVFAQAGGAARPAGEGSPNKIGVINIQIAITSTGEGKQATAELQVQFAARQAELETLNRQIEDVRNKLRAGAMLSDEEKARLARQGDQWTRSLQRKQQELQDDSNEAQREVVDRIGNKMLQVIDVYSKQNNFALILDNSQNSIVLNFSPQVDITQDIIRLFDQANPPVKTGATPAATAPARPAQPRPQPQAPKPPPQ